MDELEIDPSLLEEVIEEVNEEELAAIAAEAAALDGEEPTTLSRLAELLTDRIMEVNALLNESGQKRTMVLVEASSCTVLREDDLYRRVNLIGGEEFELVAAYASKDDKTLYWVLRPTFSCNFLTMHLAESDMKKVAGFNNWSDQLSGLLEERNELRRNAAAERERTRIGSHQEYKEMGFGSW